MRPVLHTNEGLGLYQIELQLCQKAKRPVRTVDHLEDQRVLFSRARDDPAVSGYYFVLDACVMESSMPVRRRLYRATRNRTSDGYAPELGHHGRHEAVLHRLLDQVGEGDAGLGHAHLSFLVYLENLIQRGDIDRPAREPLVTGYRNDVVHAALVDMHRLSGLRKTRGLLCDPSDLQLMG